MTDAEDRRTALERRVAALSSEQRRALARALGDEEGGGGRIAAPQLVAFLATSAEPPSLESLDGFLRERVPEYMVPGRYVLLDALPRTPAGKLDRNGLERAGGQELDRSAPELVAPRNETEARLAEIWKDVLGVDEISVHDDFFEIGGDSLLSIRAISRAGRAGIPVRPEAFFDGPTIARIAAISSDGPVQPNLDPVTGEAPLTPIQSWFFEHVTEGAAHWNQSILLRAPASVGSREVDAAARELVAHHDGLRLRIAGSGDGRRQWFDDVSSSAVPEPRLVDVGGLSPEARTARIEAVANEEHASFDLARGGLVRVVLFRGGDGFRRILLVAHHLLVDAVSWGILLEDLSTLLAQAVEGRPLRLPPKTRSALAWAQGLAELARDPSVGDAVGHWSDPVPEPSWIRIPRDGDGGAEENRAGNAAVRRISLDPDETAALLARGAGRPMDRPRERVLAALLLAWCRWTGRAGLQLDVEGHGRATLGEGHDVSRTVGWLTTVFPLTLALPEASPEAALARVEEVLAALPLDGATHGLIRYLHPDASLRRRLASRPRSELLFNYLGSGDGVLPPDSILGPAPEPTGRDRSRTAPRAYLWEVNARVAGGRLHLDVEYCPDIHHGGSVDRFAEGLVRALRDVSGSAGPLRPSFELSDLDEAGLGRVADLLADLDGG